MNSEEENGMQFAIWRPLKAMRKKTIVCSLLGVFIACIYIMEIRECAFFKGIKLIAWVGHRGQGWESVVNPHMHLSILNTLCKTYM